MSARRKDTAAKQLEAQLRREYRTLFRTLTKAFRAADPIMLGPDIPADEYEPEVSRVLAGLSGCRDVASVQQLVHAVFVEMFTAGIAGPLSDYRQLAQVTWALWKEHRSGT